MTSSDQEQWLKEFAEFSGVEGKDVQVSVGTFKTLRARLFPNPWMVFAKVAALHALVGFLSLAICNQFGLNPFQTDQSLMDWFMKIGGHSVCMLLCGVFFIAATYLLANFFLSLEELESIRRFDWLQNGIIGIGSLAAFYFFGAHLVVTFAVIWIFGVLVGGFLSVEGSYRLRRAWQH